MAAFFLLTGCVATVDRPSTDLMRSSDLVSRYAQTSEPLHPQRLTATVKKPVSTDEGPREVFIIVHPAYAVFFRDPGKDAYSPAKYSLLMKQFENEAHLIETASAEGNVVVLVLPGDYPNNSSAPQSYVSYLNTVTAGGQSVYYVLSESSSSGVLPANDLVNLYLLIHGLDASKVMIGGGYIGRCQREFYNQLTGYLDNSLAFVVPEISTISPDDVSDEEALRIASSLDNQDYSPVKQFIDRKTGGRTNVQSMPRKPDL